MTLDHFDAVVLGMGPGGEVVADRLLEGGMRVAVVERELIGGECAYWACIPSKTVLRPAEVLADSARAAGVRGSSLVWEEAREYRDYMVRHLDDTAQATRYDDRGATVIRDTGRVAAPGRVDAGGMSITADHIVVATGSDAVIPDVPGLDAVKVWTNREVFSTRELPDRATVVGGSAVGIETASFLARFGVAVTLVQRGRMLSREGPRVGALAEEALRAAGVRLRLGRTPIAARVDGSDSSLELDDGSFVGGDVIVFATGRSPRTAGLGLELAGVRLEAHGGVAVDERCRAANGIWAVGDVTGVLPFTHVAKYQGRVVADNILGGDRRARYDGIPRVIFSDPEIAAVGLTETEATHGGVRTAEAEVSLSDAIARPWTYERDPRGTLCLLADLDRRVLVGAWAVAPDAGEWIHYAALAIRAAIPLDVLTDQVAQFPTFTEGYFAAVERLARRR